MPAPNNYSQVDPLRYLAQGVNDADRRSTHLENTRAVSGWINPVLINGYEISTEEGTSPPQYRMYFASHDLEFRGHVDGLGADSGDIAYYLSRPFWPPFDRTYLTDVRISLTEFGMCRVFVSSTDGSVTYTLQ